MKRHLISLLIIVVIGASALTLAPQVSAGDDFDATVHRMSARLGQRPLHIPLLGALLFFTPARGSHVKLATFENVKARFTLADLELSMGGVLSPEWHPFVKVDSRRDHECTLIYSRTNGSDMRLMVITAETDEVTVVQVDVPKKQQEKWLDDTRHHVHNGHPGDLGDSDGDGA